MPQPKKSKATSSALTKEHFDQAIKTLATKEDLKRQIADGVKHVMGHTNTQTEKLTGKLDQMDESINIKLDAIYKMLDVRKEMEKHREWIKKIAEKSGVK